MKNHRLKFQTHVHAPVEFAFRWHEQPGAFRRLSPPWENLELVHQSGGIEDGGEVHFKVQMAPGIWQSWHAKHFGFEKNIRFCDEQVKGPFDNWTHSHNFERIAHDESRIDDDLDFELPLDPLSRFAPEFMVEGKVNAMFAWRARIADLEISRHFNYGLTPMKIAITGASGLVGGELTPYLTTGGHQVVPIVRRRKGDGKSEIYWNPKSGIPSEERKKLEGVDAVIHLAGESVFGIWTKDKKDRIRRSRVEGTRSLCESLAQLTNKPKVLVCASAIGIYGNGDGTPVEESTPPGDGFLADVAREWEEACEPARAAGIRVVNLRVGIVLTPKGGALKTMLTPFKFCLGGRLGSGEQYMSWIAMEDLLGLIHHAIAQENISGPMNGTAPEPVTNRAFTKTLASVLHRPVGPPAPAFILRTVLGSMADNMMLSDIRAVPRVALDTGYKFGFTDLRETLQLQLGRKPR